MYLTNPKRYDYNISPHLSDDFNEIEQPFTSFARKYKPIQLSGLSPIENRSLLNASFEQKYKKTVPYTSHNIYAKQSGYAEQSWQEKGRKNSIKNNQISQQGQKNPNRYSRGESNKQSKFLKKEEKQYPLYAEKNTLSNTKFQSRSQIDQSKQFIEPQKPHIQKKRRQLQENSNLGNIPNRQLRKKEIEEGILVQVNEKELIEKIGRINRINGEINARLQRMLVKIDGV